MIAMVIASTLVAIVFFVFKERSSKKEIIDNRVDMPRTFQKDLHIKDKFAFLERIDYWIEEKNFKEAKHLCEIFIDHNGYDKDISRRLEIIFEKNS